MNIFLICPVRNVNPEFRERLDRFVAALERDECKVYYPPRDTDQNDDTGLRICKDNRAALWNADIVYFTWDGQSQGCLFDAGMAFAFGKKIIIVEGFVPKEMKTGKSFINMIMDWELNGAY